MARKWQNSVFPAAVLWRNLATNVRACSAHIWASETFATDPPPLISPRLSRKFTARLRHREVWETGRTGNHRIDRERRPVPHQTRGSGSREKLQHALRTFLGCFVCTWWASSSGAHYFQGSKSRKYWNTGKTELSTTTALDQILANLAKAMVDMIFLCFPGFGYLP